MTIGEAMAAELERQRPGWLEAVRLYVLQVLLTLARDWDWPAAPERASRAATDDLSRIRPALDLVASRPHQRVGREEAAGACALSVRQFATVFQRAMRVGFGRFAFSPRLATAAHHLLCTDMSVEAIAHVAGFVDGNHLYRAFRQHYGQNPTDYRREARGTA